MPRILDRYVVREVLLPLFLSLLVITFLLEMPPILDQGEKLAEGPPGVIQSDERVIEADFGR